MDKTTIQDRFLEAVKLLTEQTIANLQYDKTVECVVVSTEKKTDGIYTVEYGAAQFEAYAKTGESYYENDVVLVQIPQSDFNKQKHILGRRDNKEAASKAYNFKFPFDNFVALNQVTSMSPKIPMEYIANHPDHGNSLEYDDRTSEDDVNRNLVWAYENIGDNALFGTKLGIKVNVQTLLSGYNVREGNYGFQILINGTRIDSDNEATKNFKDVAYFTNDNMYGNPYNYAAPTEQQIILDISKYKTIDAIYIAFWQKFTQDSNGKYEGSFKNAWGELIPYADDSLAGTGLTEIPANLKFSNLEVYTGMSVDEINTDTLFIYTYDSLQYSLGDTSRTIHLAWIRYYDAATSAELIDATDELYKQDAKVYWYIHDSNWTPDNPEYDSNQASHRFGGMFWRPMETYEDLMSITIDSDINRSHNRYKAVVHYDGTYIQSDVIRFNNKVDVDALAEDFARNDQYILRCATYTQDPELRETTLYADDAIGNFYVYDENNNVLTNDKNELYSDVIYYIEIWAKTTTEDGNSTYVRLSDYADDDGRYEPFIVDWKFPENQTMISQFNTIERGEAYFPLRTEDQFARDFAATRSFRVARTYNMRYADNTISAVIQRGGQTITIKKTLYFGRAAALGCEYTPVIFIDSPEGNYYIDTNSTYEINCMVYDRRGNILDAAMRPECSFEWKFYGGTNKPTYYHAENKNGFVGNVIKGRLFTCEPFVVEVTVTGAADYPLTVRRGIMVCNDSQFIQEHDIQCPDRIEFRSDGQSPKYYHNNFSIATLAFNEKNKYLYPDWHINNEKVLKLIKTEVDNQTYVAASGNEVTGGAHTEYSLGFSGQKVFGAALNDDFYAQQWTDKLLSDEYFTYIYFSYGTATVAQAIAFDKNTYASSLVNEWDGQSLSLDYENSAVIAKMIAAGSKDKKNRFTGVMMGDWSEKGDESLDITGLYGFSAGSQTFAFKQDGTGFIGPSGKGRIHFDGRNALISNSDRSCYLNLNPVMVKKYLDTEGNFTEDEIWDLTNESGYSQYFLYCQVPKKENTQDAWDIADFDETTGEYIDKTWAQKFINPSDDDERSKYDFFLVDPNNGVVTSGGIYARYGILGKKYPWIISDSGLTQKNFYGTIFLGNPEYVKNSEKFRYNHISQIEPTYTMDGEEVLENGMYSMVFTDKSNRVHTALRTDGYLFTEYATIGNWYINDYEIYLPKTEKAFRKFYQKVVSEFDDRPTYCLDTINLNAKDGVLAFNEGHMLIDGKNGLMGFDKENHFTKNKYTMMMDFSKGLINFAKLSAEEEPHAQIDGTNGIAYFAKKNIIISGKDAVMYIGSPVKVNGVAPTEQKQGTIYLAQIKIWGLSANDAGADANISLPVSTGGSGIYSLSSQTILPFEFQLSEDESAIEGGVLELWQPANYNTILYNQSGGGTINSAGVCYVGYVKDQFTIEDTRTSLAGGGLNIGVGGNGVILQPAGAAGTEGYLAGNWHLIAKDIKATTVIMDEGYIKDGTNYVAIASQYWVYNSVANPLWSGIVKVNNLAAEALKKAGTGIYKANQALKKIEETAITKIMLSPQGGPGLYTLKVVGYNAAGAAVTDNEASSLLIASKTHKHNVTGSFKGGILEITGVTGNAVADSSNLTITADLSAGITNLQGNDSQLTWSTFGGGTGSFDIADTQYYKNALESSAVIFNEGSNTITFTNKNGDEIVIDVTEVYNAGWAAAASGCGRSGMSNTVTYPTSTVGQKTSVTANLYDSHGYTINRTYKQVTEADVGTTVIASAEGSPTGTSYIYWT